MKFSLLKLFLIVTIFATVICYGSYRHRGFAQQVDKVLTRAGHGKDGGNYHIQVYGNDIRPAVLVFIDHHVDPSRPGKFPAIDFASPTPPALPRLVVAGEPVNLANGIAIVCRSTTGYAETIRIRSSKQDELIADFLAIGDFDETGITYFAEKWYFKR